MSLRLHPIAAPPDRRIGPPPTPAGRSVGRVRRRAARLGVAVACAAVFHLGIFALLIWQARVSTVRFAVPPGPSGVTVSLVSLPMSLSREAAQAPDPQPQLDDLRRRLALQADTAAATAPTPPSADGAKALMKLFGDQPASAATAPAKAAPSGPAAGGSSWAIRTFADPYGMASVMTEDALRSPAPALWAQVARCWRGAPASAPVQMRITLDAQGRLAGQPVVVGDPTGADANQVAAAARRALVACAPYHAPASARTFAVVFGVAQPSR